MNRMQRFTSAVSSVALVLIAGALIWSAVQTELQRRTIESLMTGSVESGPTRLETSVQVLEISHHVTIEPGEATVIDLAPGVWQILSGMGNVEGQYMTLTSLEHRTAASWTGFSTIVSVISDPVAARETDSAGLVMPGGPMEIAMHGSDQSWPVDIRRVICPEDVMS